MKSFLFSKKRKNEENVESLRKSKKWPIEKGFAMVSIENHGEPTKAAAEIV